MYDFSVKIKEMWKHWAANTVYVQCKYGTTNDTESHISIIEEYNQEKNNWIIIA